MARKVCRSMTVNPPSPVATSCVTIPGIVSNVTGGFSGDETVFFSGSRMRMAVDSSDSGPTRYTPMTNRPSVSLAAVCSHSLSSSAAYVHWRSPAASKQYSVERVDAAYVPSVGMEGHVMTIHGYVQTIGDHYVVYVNDSWGNNDVAYSYDYSPPTNFKDHVYFTN